MSTPRFKVGDRVVIGLDPALGKDALDTIAHFGLEPGDTGTVTAFRDPHVTVEWDRTSAGAPDLWHETYLDPAKPQPRVLMVAIPLTDDPSEDPTSVTELIDFIAEHHAEVTFVPTQS